MKPMSSPTEEMIGAGEVSPEGGIYRPGCPAQGGPTIQVAPGGVLPDPPSPSTCWMPVIKGTNV
jgi:hypothetical protein